MTKTRKSSRFSDLCKKLKNKVILKLAGKNAVVINAMIFGDVDAPMGRDILFDNNVYLPPPVGRHKRARCCCEAENKELLQETADEC